MKQEWNGVILAVLILSSVILVSCSSKEDEKQTQQSTDALKQLDSENQKNRANQPIPNRAPIITILAPATGSTVTSSPVAVSWTAADENNDKLMLDVAYRPIIANQEPGEFVQALPPTTPDPKSYSLDISKLAKGDYEIIVRASDGSLNGAAFSRFKFS